MSTAIHVQSSELSSFASRSLLTELVFASGDLSRAQELYQQLAREEPHNPDILTALGNIALRQGNTTKAREYWKLALANHPTDARVVLSLRLVGRRRWITG